MTRQPPIEVTEQDYESCPYPFIKNVIRSVLDKQEKKHQLKDDVLDAYAEATCVSSDTLSRLGAIARIRFSEAWVEGVTNAEYPDLKGLSVDMSELDVVSSCNVLRNSNLSAMLKYFSNPAYKHERGDGAFGQMAWHALAAIEYYVMIAEAAAHVGCNLLIAQEDQHDLLRFKAWLDKHAWILWPVVQARQSIYAATDMNMLMEHMPWAWTVMSLDSPFNHVRETAMLLANYPEARRYLNETIKERKS